MKARHLIIALAGASVLFAARPSNATLITIQFEGVIDGSGISGIAAGETFTGIYTYDDQTADAFVDPSTGRYSDAILSYDLSFSGGLSLSQTSNGFIQIEDDVFAKDNYFANSFNDDVIWSLSLTDNSATAFDSDALVIPVQEDFDILTFRMLEQDPNNGFASGTVTSLSVVPTSVVPTSVVPEPGSLLLLGSGLFGVAAARRRRRGAVR